MEYNINRQVQSIMICFEEIHSNPSGVPTLKLTDFVINPRTIEQCREEFKDYILGTAISVVIAYTILIFMVKKAEFQISFEKYFLIMILFVLMRLMFGRGYQSIIPHTAKLLTVLLNCIITVFLIFLIVRKNDESEQSEG